MCLCARVRVCAFEFNQNHAKTYIAFYGEIVSISFDNFPQTSNSCVCTVRVIDRQHSIKGGFNHSSLRILVNFSRFETAVTRMKWVRPCDRIFPCLEWPITKNEANA